MASKAGFACEYTTRHMDSVAIDAIVREDGRFLAKDSLLGSFEIHVQLKATYQQLKEINGRWSFSLALHQYNRLRATNIQNPRNLVVMQLPPNPVEWLQHSEDLLTLRRCAYWVSLYGAPESDNLKEQTVYVPSSQLLSPDTLTALMSRFSRREVIFNAS